METTEKYKSLKQYACICSVLLAYYLDKPSTPIEITVNNYSSEYLSLVPMSPYIMAGQIGHEAQKFTKAVSEEIEHSFTQQVSISDDMSKNYKVVNQAIDKALRCLGNGESIGGKEFLKEIAMTETRLGTHPNTIRTSGNAGRGIWQIDEIAFKETKNVEAHPVLKQYLNNLKKSGINWQSVRWNDCNKPLYGAIAARLYLVCKPFEIGANRAMRAKQWKRHYNTSSGKGTEEIYWNKVKECYAEIGLKDKYPNEDYYKYLKNI